MTGVSKPFRLLDQPWEEEDSPPLSNGSTRGEYLLKNRKVVERYLARGKQVYLREYFQLFRCAPLSRLPPELQLKLLARIQNTSEPQNAECNFRHAGHGFLVFEVDIFGVMAKKSQGLLDWFSLGAIRHTTTRHMFDLQFSWE